MDFSQNNLPDDHKVLKELILYFAERLGTDEYFGATKLNKLLFYSDYIAYAELGESITKEEYFKIDFGPAPKYLRLAKEELISSGDITPIIVKKGAKTQKRIAAKRQPDLTIFSSAQISIIEGVIEFLAGKTASQISEDSHFIGWHLARFKETIPYESVYIGNPSDVVITSEIDERLKKLTDQNGL